MPSLQLKFTALRHAQQNTPTVQSIQSAEDYNYFQLSDLNKNAFVKVKKFPAEASAIEQRNKVSARKNPTDSELDAPMAIYTLRGWVRERQNKNKVDTGVEEHAKIQ